MWFSEKKEKCVNLKWYYSVQKLLLGIQEISASNEKMYSLCLIKPIITALRIVDMLDGDRVGGVNRDHNFFTINRAALPGTDKMIPLLIVHW